MCTMSETVTIGVVATNQERKDFGLVAAVCALLRQRLAPRQLKCWWHVDVMLRAWSIPALLTDFGLTDIVEVTHNMTDQELATRYQQCDLTLHPGLGEGFCYPLFESLACGVPAVHGNYGGGASLLATCGLEELLVASAEWRIEGQSNCVRPVYTPESWVDACLRVLEEPHDLRLHERIEHLRWPNLGPHWLKWFEAGLA